MRLDNEVDIVLLFLYDLENFWFIFFCNLVIWSCRDLNNEISVWVEF